MSSHDKPEVGVDVEDFLEFYLLDSQEQIDRLGSGILDLEREGGNIGLINELFRSAHSLKGASGTMGFTPIVEVTHAAEDLLDKVRQGKMDVTNEIIDLLLEVTDSVKIMLAQVEAREPIRQDTAGLVARIRALARGEGTVSPPAEKSAAPQTAAEPITSPNSAERISLVPFDLDDTVRRGIQEAVLFGRTVYHVTVAFDEHAVMKAVRTVMVLQRLQDLGVVFKIMPSIEEIEKLEAENQKISQVMLLMASNEGTEELKQEVFQVSDVADAYFYALREADLARLSGAAPDPKGGPAGGTEGEAARAGAAEAGRTGTAETAEKASAAPAKKEDGGAVKAPEVSNQVHTIRVDTGRMDDLINMVGEMVITRARLVKIGDDLKAQNPSDALVSSLNDTNIYLGRLMNDLQESAMRLRMVPVGTVFSRYPRLVRDFCRKTGKKITLELHGESTEMDKTVIEQIGDPLTHLIRNSVDHGIEDPAVRLQSGKPEVGKIVLSAYHEGNHIAVVISDDGAGLNLAKIRQKGISRGLINESDDLSEREIANLIFLPGFSTADKVTDISGRGVGMDVVRRALSSLGGSVDIRTKAGEGTSFTIRLPLTLAIIQALLVEVCDEIYAVPLSSVQETLMVNKAGIRTVGGLKVVKVRGNTLPLVSLKQKFGLPENEDAEEFCVVIVGLGDRQIGLTVDKLKGQQEIVLKTLGEDLGALPGISGATILGDGKVTLILDIGSLIQDVVTN